MFLLNVFIFVVLLSSSLAKDSCLRKIDYEYYLIQDLIVEVGQRVKTMKENVNAAGNVTCPYKTCADGWISYKGSCYLFSGDKAMSFSSSKIFCAQFGATMLHVDDAEKNDFIVGILKEFKDNTWWIGLTDEKTEGDWRWEDTHTTADFTSWDSGEPNGQRGSNCAMYNYERSFKWHDHVCSYNYRTICQKRLQ